MEAGAVTPGMIVGGLGLHGPGIRFGVVLAPETPERVWRTMGVAPASRPPTADEDDFYARCDHCGAIFPVSRVCLYWTYVEMLDDGRAISTTGIFCSEPCGELSSNRGGSSRG
jgi:hypothetical protein